MSMSGYSNSQLGKEPLRYYEGDPYRPRPEPGPPSGRGHVREPVDRRFQNSTSMPPQMTYGNRDEREWYSGGQYPHKPEHSAGNHLPEQNTSAYQSSGHPNSCPNNHASGVYRQSGRPDDPYPSPGYPNKNFVHHKSYPQSSSYSSPRKPPVNRPVSSGHMSSAPPGHTSQTNCPPHENGFREDVRQSLHHPSPPSSMHSVHHPSSNGPQPPSREFWKPQAPQDHVQGSPQPMHEGMQHSSFRPGRPDSSYSSPQSNYRQGPEGPNFRPDGGPPAHVMEGGYWHNSGGPPRERQQGGPLPTRSQAGWESGGDPRVHPQRRISETPTSRKNFVVTNEERWHNHLPLDRYSPSLSSQSSWSPGFDESGSPRLRMPQPPHSTSEDCRSTPEHHHTPESSYPCSRHHPHPHHHANHPHPSSSVEPLPGKSPFPGQLEKGERVGGGGLLKTPPECLRSRRFQRDTGGYLRGGPNYNERRAPLIINGLDPEAEGGQKVQDPRRKRAHLGFLLEHSYSKPYRRGAEKHPRFHQIGMRTDLKPEFLTELQSVARTKAPPGKCSTADDANSSRQPSTTGPPPSTESSHKHDEYNQLHSNPSEKQFIPSIEGATGSSGVPKSSGPQDGTAPEEMKMEGRTIRRKQVTKSSPTSEMGSSTLETDGSHSQGKLLKMSDDSTDKGLPVQAEEGKDPLRRQGGSKATAQEKIDSLDALCSLDGFSLDLDLEPASGSNSNSTCCSESEETGEGKNEDSDMDVEEAGQERDGNGTAVDELSSCDESHSLSHLSGVDKPGKAKKSPEKWSVCLPEPGKMRFSRLDNIEDASPDAERLSLKQMTSNRIQLRNGRVLPPSSLAFLAASQKVITSPPRRPASTASDSLMSPPSSTTSGGSDSSPRNNGGSSGGGSGHLRRSKRLAKTASDSGSSIWKESGSAAGSESPADRSFEMRSSDELSASSDESELDLPDFRPEVLKPCLPESPLYKLPSESKTGRGKGRGRGRGRWGRRGGKRGGVRSSKSVDSSSGGAGSPGAGGVQFYVHEPRTREEDGILQRRLALEIEVKRNEMIQSEQNISASTQHLNTKDDDRGSVMSESLPASSFSLESLQTLSKTSTNSTEFSADLIARVKKISTARSSGDTPLHKCSRTGKFDMVRYLLLVENCPVNIQDNAGWTPLHEATSNNHTDIAELLLQHGADSNASARDGTRPIHDAIEIGSLDLVKLLIDHKADLMVEYGERTAIEFAKDQDQLEIADYIKDVIQSRQAASKASVAALAAKNTVPHKPNNSTRTSKKDKLLKQAENHTPRIPVNGYGPGRVVFGKELDFPLFFVSPTVELSSQPHLPVYNFQISPPGTVNPRRHNFYLMDDLLKALNMEEKELIEECNEVNILELTVAEFLHRMKLPHYNFQVTVPERIKSMPRKRAIKFVPLCQMVSRMLDIVTENLDN